MPSSRTSPGPFWATIAVVVLFGLVTSLPVHADTKSDLAAAKKRLSQLEREVADAQARQANVQAQADAIQGQIQQTESAITRTQRRIETTLTGIRRRESRIVLLQNRLGARARDAYIRGPGGVFEVFLGSSSFGDLTDRLALYDAVQQSDADLAASVEEERIQLEGRKHDLDSLKASFEAQKRDLEGQRAKLQMALASLQEIVASRVAIKDEVTTLVETLTKRLKDEAAAARAAALAAQLGGGGGGGPVVGTGVFRVCPVDAPNAFGDDFGAPRYGGGYHPHAGNDIVAPLGTPIRAPFDGVAENASNGLGGLSVYVRGPAGYTYNAHLSRLGTLGSVSAGTIVGYVGNSGDAAGGPYHDHFEWHPSSIPANPYRSAYGYTVIGSAIDPFPFLVAACR